MKNNKHSRLAVISLILLGTGSFCIAKDPGLDSSQEKPIRKGPDYDSVLDLLKDFLDLSVKPTNSIDYWAQQVILIIKQKNKEEIQRLAPFLKDFHQATKTRNALLLGMSLTIHQGLFEEPVVTYLKNRIREQGQDSILQIIKERMKK